MLEIGHQASPTALTRQKKVIVNDEIKAQATNDVVDQDIPDGPAGSDVVLQELPEASSNRVLVYSRAEGHVYPVKSARSDAHLRSMQMNNVYQKGVKAPTPAAGSTANAASQECRQAFSSMQGEPGDEASSTLPAGSTAPPLGHSRHIELHQPSELAVNVNDQ